MGIFLIDIKKGSSHCFDIIKSTVRKDPQAKSIGITTNFYENVKTTLQQIGVKVYLLRNDDISVMEKMIYEVNVGRTMFTSRPLER